MPKRDQVFVSYSHKDNASLQRLMVHLKPFEREESIKVWSDKKIQASQKWKNEIQNALQQTAVAILLVSADFLYSDFIADEELPHLLAAAEREGVRILPFILTACAFNGSNLSQFQAVNDPSKPLMELSKSKREKLWAELAQTTKETLDKFKAHAEAIERAASLPVDLLIKWDRVATLFWFGTELAIVQGLAHHKGSFQRMVESIDNAMVDANELGLSPYSFVPERLNSVKDIAERSIAMPLAAEHYESQILTIYKVIGKEVEALQLFIHELATNQQPDFKKQGGFG